LLKIKARKKAIHHNAEHVTMEMFTVQFPWDGWSL